MITLNAIAQRLEEFATNHFFIKSYSFGSPDDVDLEKFEVFPLMHVVYTGSDYDERTKTFSFEVYVFDRPNREEQMTTHQREVVSDAQMCLEDIVADIANGGNVFLFSEDYSVANAGITPLIDERSNLLAGALMDLTISVPYQRDACNLPIDGVSPEGGVITYQRRGILRVREQDGTPDVQSVNEIRVSNGTLTDEGNGVVSIDTGGVDMLRDLTDVTITDVLEHDSLIYDSTASQWVNGVPTDIPVINTTAFNFTAGTPLRADGVQGDRIKINVWRPTNDPKLFMGLATEDINANTTGFVRQIGIVHHLNTEGYQIGDILYPISTLGLGMSALGTTPPTPPNHAIACAIVLRVHENTGRVYVRTWTPAYDLGDLSDVYLTTQNDGQALTWNAANNRWQAGNAAPRSLGDISDVYDYDPNTLADRTILRWSSSSEIWELVPQTSGLPTAYYLGAYDTEAGTGRTAASTASITVERYLTIQGDGEGESISAQSDTPTSGNKIVRKIWYKANSFEQTDVDTWTLLHTFADDTAYASTTATFEALLNAQTYGTPPFTLAQSWEDIPAFTGLLDTYSGASAAYSLRLLDSTYTGYAINVRRASDNAVQDIGFDANGDLNTSALATFCSGTDGYVVRWYDQSGNGNDAVQATTSAQPQIVSGGTVVTDSATSKSTLNYAGNRWMQLTSAISVTAQSLFFVEQINAAILTNNSWSNNIGFADATGLFFSNAGVTSKFSGFSFYNTSLVSFHRDGANPVSAYQDSQQLTIVQDLVSTQTGTYSYIGINGSRFYNRIMSEIIIYPSDQSSNRTGIETNINDYYSIY